MADSLGLSPLPPPTDPSCWGCFAIDAEREEGTLTVYCGTNCKHHDVVPLGQVLPFTEVYALARRVIALYNPDQRSRIVVVLNESQEIKFCVICPGDDQQPPHSGGHLLMTSVAGYIGTSENINLDSTPLPATP